MAPGGRKKGKKVPSGPVADKPCHNCRRRRLRCDRLLPHCAKCEAKGVECLGYTQIFQWTGAVASRGRLAGQQSSAALYTPARPSSARSRASLSSVSSVSSASPASTSSVSCADSPSVTSSPAFIAPSLSQVEEVTETSEGEFELESESELDPINDIDFDIDHENGDDAATPLASGYTQLVCTTSHNHPLASETSTPWVLVDPLYQDITSNHRQYLAYCT